MYKYLENITKTQYGWVPGIYVRRAEAVISDQVINNMDISQVWVFGYVEIANFQM